METQELESLVLALVTGPDYRPVKPKVIGRLLELDKEQQRELKKAIKSLVKRGQLSYGSNHLVEPPGKAKPDRSYVTGTFRRASGGYGFVRPTLRERRPGREDDIFVPQRRSLDAASGDLVKVRVRRSFRGGVARLQGQILEVLERETHQFVGTYQQRAGTGYVQIDGNLFAHAIAVGDPGAKNAVEGDKVVMEMVRFPSHLHDGEGVIVEVLGPRGAPGVDTLSIMREFNLPEQFPEEVLESAREEAERFEGSIAPDRLDLTALTVVTIDPKDARDFDDAISLERLENGHLRLGVHIADVSHFVRPKTPVDREARERGTSVYLPDRVIPMLPEIISNNLASLQPNRVRYTRSAFLEFTPDGQRVSAEVRSSAIKSCRRFTYEEVDQFLADRMAWRAKLSSEVFQLLDAMHRLAMTLRKRRRLAGALELTLPEIKVDLDKKGGVAGAHLVHHTESHQIIEEFMLAANEAVAELLNEQQLPLLRRIHEPPDPRKLKALTEFVRELGIACESMESRFEIQRVLDEAAGRPEEYAVSYAVLRSMQKAVYSPLEEGHYALHSRHYCHFTSPIRRYPDLTIHRMLEHLERKTRPPEDLEHQILLGEHCSEREQRAEAAERELTKIKLLNYLSTRIGQKMDGVITGVEEFGLFVQGAQLPAEGLIHVSSLQDDYYHYDKRSHSLQGHRAGNSFRLGDRIQVQIWHVDVDRRELDFRFLQRLGPSAPARRAPQKKSGKSRAAVKAKGPARGKRKKVARKPAAGGASASRRKKKRRK